MVFISHPLSAHLEQQCTDVWGTDPGPPGIAQGPPPESWRGTEGRSVLWDALFQPQERHQGELRRSTQSAFLYLNPSANLLMCISHLDSLEPHHHCQCRVRKKLTAYATYSYIFAFSVWFCFSWSKASVASISSCPFQQSTLSVSNFSALNFLDSTEVAGRSTFSNHQLPCLLPSCLHWWVVLCSWDSSTQSFRRPHFSCLPPTPSLRGSCSTPASKYMHFPDFTPHPFLVLSLYAIPFPSICIFLTLLHIPFWFCPYILSLFQSDSFVWLFLLRSRWKTLTSRLLL